MCPVSVGVFILSLMLLCSSLAESKRNEYDTYGNEKMRYTGN